MTRRTEAKAVNATADGDNTLITGVSGKTIRVLGYALTVSAAAGALILKSGASGTEHARFVLAANGGVARGNNESVIFECDKGASLVSNNPATVDLLGEITYEIT